MNKRFYFFAIQLDSHWQTFNAILSPDYETIRKQANRTLNRLNGSIKAHIYYYEMTPDGELITDRNPITIISLAQALEAMKQVNL